MAEGMLRNIRAGETFIVWDDDTPAATITVARWANPDLWAPEEAAEPALYAHKLTVARAYAGRGLGVELLDWAGSRAAADGARWLRVDVWTTNRELQQYYLDHGFRTCGPSPWHTTRLGHCSSGQLAKLQPHGCARLQPMPQPGPGDFGK
jgi:GNAT superfamily N-acetyltransferase